MTLYSLFSCESEGDSKQYFDTPSPVPEDLPMR